MVPNPSHSILRITAGYMVVLGIVGLIWPLLHLGPNHPEFQAQSVAYKLGAHTRELILSAASVVAGIGLFSHHAWARTLALGLLLVEIVYGTNAFAWGFSGGQPTSRVRFFSRIVVSLWNGLWFYLIYRLAL